MEPYDWSKFTKRISVDAGVQRVYELLSTRTGLEQWFLRLAEFTPADNKSWTADSTIREGDEYRWMWHGYGDDVVEKGRILEANGKDRIRFTFAGDCIVTFSISKLQESTIVEICQENIPTDEQSKIKIHLGCSEGWTFYLANLKSILEGGVDLRNKDESLQGVLNS